MKINTKIRYGLRTMIQIALDNKSGIFQKDIADKQELPIKYLDHIIAALKAENLVRRHRGKRSGYILGRPAQDISVYDIYLAFEPELTLVPCVEEHENCNRIHYCAATKFWTGLNEQVKGYLELTTLKDLVEMQKDRVTNCVDENAFLSGI